MRLVALIIELDIFYSHQEPLLIVLQQTNFHLLHFELELKLILQLELMQLLLSDLQITAPITEELTQSQHTGEEGLAQVDVHFR